MSVRMQKKASDTQQSTENDKKTEPHNYNPEHYGILFK